MLSIARKLPEPPRNATYQDVLDAPENMVTQLIDGELHLHARPVDPHVWAGWKLSIQIEHRYGGNFDSDGDASGDWVILPEPELRLGKDALVPDIAGWRVNKHPRNQANSFSEVVPNWVCEVLSPTTRNIDLGRKSDIYARARASRISGSSTRRSGRCRYRSSPAENGFRSRH